MSRRGISLLPTRSAPRRTLVRAGARCLMRDLIVRYFDARLYPVGATRFTAASRRRGQRDAVAERSEIISDTAVHQRRSRLGERCRDKRKKENVKQEMYTDVLEGVSRNSRTQAISETHTCREQYKSDSRARSRGAAPGWTISSFLTSVEFPAPGHRFPSRNSPPSLREQRVGRGH